MASDSFSGIDAHRLPRSIGTTSLGRSKLIFDCNRGCSGWKGVQAISFRLSAAHRRARRS